MSFADELKKEPELKKKEDEALLNMEKSRRSNAWNKMLDEYLEYIKTCCRERARNECTQCKIAFESFVTYCDREYSQEDWWKTVQYRIRDDLSECGKQMICMSLQDVESVEQFTTSNLENEGLSVCFKRHEYQKRHSESHYVPYSSAATKLLLRMSINYITDDNGYYKTVWVEDEIKYTFFAQITW
ncbi:hypothetical protein NE562_00775 [Butyricicoccus faecihominis]|uniref:hypothetical protein n=1 Tax=Butyricicoccus faecihominis TaxID=1712515 RepID=UPI00247A0EDE|nr:hypothetical protein [Butyricicoccus faecihominis]MCQ5128174.1 hypothetical protein [Butyricicoccus faecihominis]